MIRLRNLDKGTGRFNGARPSGTVEAPYVETTLLDLQDLNFKATTGWTGIRMTGVQRSVAQASGTNFTARFRAENRVTTSIGTMVALECYAQNRNASASLSVMGFSATADGRGVDAALVRGAEIISINDLGTGTITTQVGLRVRVVGSGTVTNGPWGIQIVNGSADAAAAPVPLAAAIRIEDAATSTIGALIDASTQRTTVHDTDQVTLMKFLAADGTTVKTMSYDTSGNALVFA